MKIARCDKMFCHVKEKAPKTEISIKLCESRDVICSALDGTWHQQRCQIGSHFPAQSSNPDWQATASGGCQIGQGESGPIWQHWPPGRSPRPEELHPLLLAPVPRPTLLLHLSTKPPLARTVCQYLLPRGLTLYPALGLSSTMGLTFSSLFTKLFGKKQMRILMGELAELMLS